jgi:hypothetical protein
MFPGQCLLLLLLAACDCAHYRMQAYLGVAYGCREAKEQVQLLYEAALLAGGCMLIARAAFSCVCFSWAHAPDLL